MYVGNFQQHLRHVVSHLTHVHMCNGMYVCVVLIPNAAEAEVVIKPALLYVMYVRSFIGVFLHLLQLVKDSHVVFVIVLCNVGRYITSYSARMELIC